MPTARSSKDVDAGDVWPGDAVDSPDASSDEAPSFVPSEAVDSPDVSSDEAPTFVPSQASSPREKDKQVGRELQEELTRHLLGGRRRSDVGQILLATVAVFVFWGSLHSLLSVGWLVLFVVLAGVRAAWRGWATRATTEVLKLRSMIRGDIWVSAVLWGVLSILMVGEPLATLAFLMVIVAGLVAVATSTLVADGRSFLGFTGILIGSLVATIVLSGTSRDHGSLLLIVALFTPFMVSVQRQANAVLRSQIESATRLRLSEEETVRGRDFLKALVAHAPSAILILDQGGRVRNANPAFERITGFALDEVRGHDLASLITDAEQAGELTAFLETIKEGAQSITELRLEKKGGDPMWIRLAGTAAGSEADDRTPKGSGSAPFKIARCTSAGNPRCGNPSRPAARAVTDSGKSISSASLRPRFGFGKGQRAPGQWLDLATHRKSSLTPKPSPRSLSRARWGGSGLMPNVYL